MNASTKERIIFHIDFDYFFAQCEELRTPELRGKPVVVCVYSGRTEDSGAVSTANYEARKYNVRSGMPINLAKKRLKDISDVSLLPVDHEYYKEMSDKAMNIIQNHADKFEIASIDEAFIDVGEALKYEFTRAVELAVKIKDQLRNVLKLSCSIGIASNKLVAKIASDFEKPDGLVIVHPGDTQSFLRNLDVSKVVGIGKKTEECLNQMNVKTIGQLAELDIYSLTKMFGRKNSVYIFNSSRGIDNEPVNEDDSVTQISRIMTLKKSINSVGEIYEDLASICRDVHKSATDRGLSFKSVGIILILDDLSTRTKSKSLRAPSMGYHEIFKTSISLFEEALSGSQLMVRRIGVKISELIICSGQDTLFKFMEE